MPTTRSRSGRTRATSHASVEEPTPVRYRPVRRTPPVTPVQTSQPRAATPVPRAATPVPRAATPGPRAATPVLTSQALATPVHVPHASLRASTSQETSWATSSALIQCALAPQDTPNFVSSQPVQEQASAPHVLAHDVPAPRQKAGSSRGSRQGSWRLAKVLEELALAKIELCEARMQQINIENAESEDQEDQYSSDESNIEDEYNEDSPQRVQSWLENRAPESIVQKTAKIEKGTKHPYPQLKHEDNLRVSSPEPVEQRPAIESSAGRIADMGLSDLAMAITQACRSGATSSRYVMDLPQFNGSYTQWLAFKAAFDETAKQLTEVENTARLRRALRGRAKEIVQPQLIANANAQNIMEQLEESFGRSDAIAKAEMAKLRNIGRPTDSPRDICSFSSKIRNSVATLKVLNKTRYLYNPEIIQEIVDKLTPALRYRWIDFVSGKSEDEPDLQVFDEFIGREAKMCGRFAPPEKIEDDTLPFNRNRVQRSHYTEEQNIEKPSSMKRKSFMKNENNSKRQKICSLCKKRDHIEQDCDIFKTADSKKRWDLAKENGMCFRCLSYRDNFKHRCPNKKCEKDGCPRTHHPLLHFVKPSEEETEVVTSTYSQVKTYTYLKIVPIQVTGPRGTADTFALLDDGSTVTLMDNRLAQKIGARGPIDPLKIEAVAGKQMRAAQSRRVAFTIKSRHSSEIELKARTIEGLKLSPQTIDFEDIGRCRHLEGITEYLPQGKATPMLLIGQDNWHLLIAQQTRTGPLHQPIASLTSLGWVLHGATTRQLGHRINYMVEKINHVQNIEEDINEEIKRYFAIDGLGITPKQTCGDPEKRAIEILEKNTVRLSKGGYETSLLWKTDDYRLPNNFENSLKRLYNIERKIDRDPTMKIEYSKQIENLLIKGYAELATTSSTPGKTWYLPHFAVTHPAKPGKVRVVFDAAARAGGSALNEHLLTGPGLLQSLPGVLMRFRQHKIAVAADIEEMFLRIGIKETDRDVLRFLWRDDRREGPPREYRMRSVIFGAACSPCIALYVKNMHAEKYREQYPEAARAIISNHYMDDYLQSFDNTSEAIQIAKEVKKIHSEANFNLRKWMSNSSEVLSVLQEDHDSQILEDRPLEDGTRTEKILGLIWRPKIDTLGFNLNFARVPKEIIEENKVPTKREALATIMSVYDPLGLVSPITVQAKHIIQETWRSGTGWDEQLPENLIEDWQQWIKSLKLLDAIHLPRCHPHLSDKHVVNELHTFVDASERAYAAAVYWRTIDCHGGVHVTLAAAKARVAPLKLVSIPRLELQAALIGCRLANTVAEEYNIEANKRYFWSNSKTVLSWLRAGPRTYKSFVAHRVAEIEENTTVNEWHWIPTRHNVADDATRDVPPHFNHDHRWFTGPTFLKQNIEDWPTEKIDIDKQTGEERTCHISEESSNLSEGLPKISRFSSWLRLIRTTATVLMAIDIFKKNIREKVNYKRTSKNIEKDSTYGKNKKKIIVKARPASNSSIPRSTLDTKFIIEAKDLWVLASQKECFFEDIIALKACKQIAKNSKLRQLAVKLDKNGKIVLKSRIAEAEEISASQREPAILHGDHPYTQLYIAHTHRELQHAGVEMVVNEVRQHFWVLRLRPITKTVVTSCLKCRIRRAEPAEPQTGNHPKSRLAHHQRPFTYTGLDYFGPLSVTVGRQHQKRYVALFTCLTTRAVHLEIAANLTADSAIQALRRFIARRGCPTEIYSDNGTNLRGADKILQEAIQTEASNRSIVWKYIPPGAPFIGGAWERLVRSVKTALYNVLQDRHPTEEVLHTLLCEAEYTVNSRPLTHVSTDAQDSESLTPNHFFLGGSGRVQTPGTFDDRDLSGRSHWRRAQQLANQFWARWLKEYLPDLQNRREPRGRGTALKIGDVVLIVDQTCPRNTWPKGIIVSIYPGKDNIVRAVDVQTKGGVLRRPTKKLVLLPTDSEPDVVTPIEDAAA